MKYHCSSVAFAVARVGLLVIGLWGGTVASAATATDEGVPLHIDVRSAVDRKWEGFKKLAASPTGKLYYLALVKEIEAPEKLVRPVDQEAFAKQLRAEMNKRGFREITGEEKPEIVLTANYGRGFLKNPYTQDAMIDELTPGTPTSTVTSPKQIMQQRSFDGEGKLQRAQEEKLYVTVSAWQPPTRKGEKPNLLWRTTMVTDNPDNRDLNLAMSEMFRAGVGYFGEDIKDGEVRINTTMPTGTVKLGPLNVLEEPKPAK
jgi:hypothetical protein